MDPNPNILNFVSNSIISLHFYKKGFHGLMPKCRQLHTSFNTIPHHKIKIPIFVPNRIARHV